MAEIRDTSLEELRHLVSERALRGETMLLNLGPQHPATHGVLRVLVELDGDVELHGLPLDWGKVVSPKRIVRLFAEGKVASICYLFPRFQDNPTTSAVFEWVQMYRSSPVI